MLMPALISQLELRLILPSQPNRNLTQGIVSVQKPTLSIIGLPDLGGNILTGSKPSYNTSELYSTKTSFGNLFKGPETNVFHHEKLGLFAGVLAGKKLNPTNEKGLYKTLVKSGHTPERAAGMLDRFKSGNSSGQGETTSLHHMNAALVHAGMGLQANKDLNPKLQEYHSVKCPTI